MSDGHQRREQRFRLPARPHGQITLATQDSRLPVLAIRDVSVSGISLKVAKALPVASRVLLEYRDAELSLEVRGHVAWCADATDDAGPGLEIGIELMSPMLLLAVLTSPSLAAPPRVLPVISTESRARAASG